MAIKVTKDGEMKSTKKIPKYYEPRITWIDITEEMKKKYLSTAPSRRECENMGKTINYSGESFAKLFTHKPNKVNKKIWDVLMDWYAASNNRPKIEPTIAPSKKIEKIIEKKEKNATISESTKNFLDNRRKNKLK